MEIPLRCKPGQRVIDLGTGTGRNAVFLAQRGYQVDAIDVSPVMIARLRGVVAQRGLAIRLATQDVCAPDIDFTQYGVVLCLLVLHFLPIDRALELLDRMQRLAPPGTLHAVAAITTQGDFFAVPAARSQYYPEPGELAERYRTTGWVVHRTWEHRCSVITRYEGEPPRHNVVSFVLASR